jgi:SulP family sulfate permease
MGVILLFIAATGIVDVLERLFTKPIVRGIQLGLGFILISKGIAFIGKDELLINGAKSSAVIWNISLNTIVGMLGVLLVMFLLTNKRLPAAIAVILFGLVVSALSGAFGGISFSIGFEPVSLFLPDRAVLLNALVLLVIPQIPLTVGNAIMATADTARNLFGEEKTKRSTFKSFSTSMGLANIGAGAVAGMPMCHGAGGLAAHYRFGARTGGSNLMIGAIFVVIAVVFGKMAISLLGLIPNSILGVLLLFAGLELAMLIKDVTEKKDFFVAFFIAGIALATSNMGIAFIAGMIVQYIIKLSKIEI